MGPGPKVCLHVHWAQAHEGQHLSTYIAFHYICIYRDIYLKLQKIFLQFLSNDHQSITFIVQQQRIAWSERGLRQIELAWLCAECRSWSMPWRSV